MLNELLGVVLKSLIRLYNAMLYIKGEAISQV